MTVAYIFGVLSLLFFFMLIYFLELLFFYHKELKEFRALCKEESYLHYLFLREKKMKSKRKRNFLLYLRCKCYEHRGEKERAESLAPFVKKDGLFNIE